MKNITKEDFIKTIDEIKEEGRYCFKSREDEKTVLNTLENLKNDFNDSEDFKTETFEKLKPLYEEVIGASYFLDNIIEATEKMQLNAIENGNHMSDFKNQTEKMHIRYLDKNFVETKTTGAFAKSGKLSGFINPTEAVQLRILEYSNDSLRHIENPTDKVIVTALDNRISSGRLDPTIDNVIKASTWFFENPDDDYKNVYKLIANVETISSLKPECRDAYIKNMNEIEAKDLKTFTELYETKFKDTFEDRLIEYYKDKELFDYVDPNAEKCEEDNNNDNNDNYDDYDYDDIE